LSWPQAGSIPRPRPFTSFRVTFVKFVLATYLVVGRLR